MHNTCQIFCHPPQQCYILLVPHWHMKTPHCHPQFGRGVCFGLGEVKNHYWFSTNKKVIPHHIKNVIFFTKIFFCLPHPPELNIYSNLNTIIYCLTNTNQSQMKDMCQINQIDTCLSLNLSLFCATRDLLTIAQAQRVRITQWALYHHDAHQVGIMPAKEHVCGDITRDAHAMRSYRAQQETKRAIASRACSCAYASKHRRHYSRGLYHIGPQWREAHRGAQTSS